MEEVGIVKLRGLKRIFIDNQFNIGLVLISQSVALTNLVRAVLGKNFANMSSIMMFIGVLLLFDYHRLLSLKLLKKGRAFTVTLLFLFCTFFCSLFTNNAYDSSGDPKYTLFGIAIAVALMTNSDWKNSDKYIPMLFFLSGMLSIICAWFFTDGFTNLSQRINGIYDSNGVLIADRLTLSGIPYTCILTSLCYQAKSKKATIAKIIFVITSVVCLFVVMRRALVVNIAVSVAYILVSRAMSSKKVSSGTLMRTGGILIAVGIGMYFLLRTQWFIDNLNTLFEFIQRGFATLFGDTSLGIDPSAQTRVYLRNQILREYSSYSLWEILFGKGYMYMYLDFPLLQAFVDLGITGGLVFVYIKLIYPLKNIVHPYRESTGIYLQLTALTAIMNIFYVGIPYGYSAYVPVLLLMFYDKLKSKGGIERLEDN